MCITEGGAMMLKQTQGVGQTEHFRLQLWLMVTLQYMTRRVT
jgi:hypothetical protein